MDRKHILFFLKDEKEEKDIFELVKHLFPTHNKAVINQKSLLS